MKHQSKSPGHPEGDLLEINSILYKFVRQHVSTFGKVLMKSCLGRKKERIM